MKYFKLSFIAVSLMVGLLSCTNSNDSSEATKIKPVDTTIAKIIIVDVRTVDEWIDDGHANCSVNYPLAELDKKIEALKAYNKIVVVCRSGSRAETAKEMLEQAGIKNVENKGAWQNIICT